MPLVESVPHGVDLNPLGWGELRNRFDLHERIHVDFPLDPSSAISLQASVGNFEDGQQREIVAVAVGELQAGSHVLVRNYRVVGGILTEATVAIMDLKQKADIAEVHKIRYGDAKTHLSDPTSSDGSVLMDLLRQANGQA